MQKNENRNELRKPLMAVDFTDINGQKRKIFFTINGRRKVLKCIEREIRKLGIVPEMIHKYLVVGGGKIDLKGDKGFECLYPKRRKEKVKGFYRFAS